MAASVPTTELAKRPTLESLLQKMGPSIAQALPKHISADRIGRIALTALRSTPALAKCTPQSFLGAILQASQLGLEVNTPLGQAYLIPFKDTCQLIIGYQGMMDLARRSGNVTAIYAHAVREADEFHYQYGLNPELHHIPNDAADDRGDITHVYAVARLKGGEPIFTVLTRKKVEEFRARSRASDAGPWVTDFEPMALKTAIRRLFPWLPKSAEMAIANQIDGDGEQRANCSEYSPEVAQILGSVAEETTPDLVPEGATEGRRMSLKAEPKPEVAGK